MPLATPDINALEQIVLGKCDSFVNMGIWPAGEKLDFRSWLGNFKPTEKEHALYLLNSFTYYNIDMCVALLKGTLLNLFKFISNSTLLTLHAAKWQELLADSLFMPVTGERRNITDSGNILAGHLRRDLGIPQNNIITIDQLFDASHAASWKQYKHIIFFDDFVGSGSQFTAMWTKNFIKESVALSTLSGQCKSLSLMPHYCALLGSQYGVSKIQSSCLEVDLHFSHLLLPSASPLHSESTTWPPHLKSTGATFILEASRRAGVPETDLKGFHGLALAIAFSFTIPDATLPIFHWNKNGWSPIMERR